MSQLNQSKSSQPKPSTGSSLVSPLLGQYKAFGLSLVTGGEGKCLLSYTTSKHLVFMFSVLKLPLFQFLLQILSRAAAILLALSSLTPALCLCRYLYNICSHQNHLTASGAVSPCRGTVRASSAQWWLHLKAQERCFQKSVPFFLCLFALLAVFSPVTSLPERSIRKNLQLLLTGLQLTHIWCSTDL